MTAAFGCSGGRAGRPGRDLPRHNKLLLAAFRQATSDQPRVGAEVRREIFCWIGYVLVLSKQDVIA